MATKVWNGNGDLANIGKLNRALNWTPNGVPIAGDLVQFVPDYPIQITGDCNVFAAVALAGIQVISGYNQNLTDAVGNFIQYNGFSGSGGYFAGGGSGLFENMAAGSASWQVVASLQQPDALQFKGKVGFASGITNGQVLIKTGATLDGTAGRASGGKLKIEAGVTWAGAGFMMNGAVVESATNVPGGELSAGTLTTTAGAAIGSGSQFVATGGAISHQSTGAVNIAMSGSASFDGTGGGTTPSAAYNFAGLDLFSDCSVTVTRRATFTAGAIRLHGNFRGPLFPAGTILNPTPP